MPPKKQRGSGFGKTAHTIDVKNPEEAMKLIGYLLEIAAECLLRGQDFQLYTE